MKAQGELRLHPEADTAILLIHGILGTPAHFAPLLPLIPENWSVCNLLLEGHGGSVRDFAAASMAVWKRQVHDAYVMLLSKHRKVVIAAHSMGTLFAIQEAVEIPAAALFLLNVPLCIRPSIRLLRTTWHIYSGRIPPDDVWSLAAQNAYGIERDRNLLHYLGWLPQYLDLFKEIRKTRSLIAHLAVPCCAFLSRGDEMVSVKSAKFLAGNPQITLKILENSGHFYYAAPEDVGLLCRDFCTMAAEVRRNGTSEEYRGGLF